MGPRHGWWPSSSSGRADAREHEDCRDHVGVEVDDDERRGQPVHAGGIGVQSLAGAVQCHDNRLIGVTVRLIGGGLDAQPGVVHVFVPPRGVVGVARRVAVTATASEMPAVRAANCRTWDSVSCRAPRQRVRSCWAAAGPSGGRRQKVAPSWTSGSSTSQLVATTTCP